MLGPANGEGCAGCCVTTPSGTERRIVAHDDERAVLVHGDVHQWNTLRAGGGYKFVDPDGLLAEAEYDMGIVMREDPEELMQGEPYERARWLAHRTGLDPVAIWEWGWWSGSPPACSATRSTCSRFGRQMPSAADRSPGSAPTRSDGGRGFTKVGRRAGA